MKIFATALLAGCLVSPLAMADNCRYSKTINFDVQADQIQQLDIEVGAGALEIRGASSPATIGVRAIACAHSERQLGRMELRHSHRGDTLQISSDIEESDSMFSLFGTRYAYIDTVITIPAGLQVEIDDGSGDITIEDVTGNFEIDDGSGDLYVRNLVGNLDVDDGSGDIELEQVTGNITLDDGSGDINIVDVTGNVRIEEDGSGSIRIQTVNGSVTIDDDGSGSIRVNDVSGDFVAGDTGSGSLDYGNIAGRVDVRGR